MEIKKAEYQDAYTLTEIQKRSFQPDVKHCGEGPPGFNSETYQQKIMISHLYFKILLDNTIAGGFYLKKAGIDTYELVRIFIDPLHQNKGLASSALKFIETHFLDLKILELEASDFNIKNHNFYKKRGFRQIGKKDYGGNSHSFLFQKILE